MACGGVAFVRLLGFAGVGGEIMSAFIVVTGDTRRVARPRIRLPNPSVEGRGCGGNWVGVGAPVG